MKNSVSLIPIISIMHTGKLPSLIGMLLGNKIETSTKSFTKYNELKDRRNCINLGLKLVRVRKPSLLPVLASGP